MLPECGKCALPPLDPHGTDRSGGTSSVCPEAQEKRNVFREVVAVLSQLAERLEIP